MEGKHLALLARMAEDSQYCDNRLLTAGEVRVIDDFSKGPSTMRSESTKGSRSVALTRSSP